MRRRRDLNMRLFDIPAFREAFMREWSRPGRPAVKDLAERFCVSRQEIWKWARELGVERRRVTDDAVREYLGKLMSGALVEDQLLPDTGLQDMVRRFVAEENGLLGGLTEVRLLVPEEMKDKLRSLQAAIVRKHLETLETTETMEPVEIKEHEEDEPDETHGDGEGCVEGDGGGDLDEQACVGNDGDVDGEVGDDEWVEMEKRT